MKAYSQDLRERLFSYSFTHTVRETARLFQVSPSTVQELRRLFCETGALDSRPPGAARPRTISPEGELYVQVLLREQVDLTLQELCTRYTDTYGVPVSLSTMHATLKRLGITRKKRPPTTRTRPALRSRPTRTAITAKSTPFRSTSASTSMRPGAA